MVGLSQDDLERIRAFAEKPRYERDPSELMSEFEGEPSDMSGEHDRVRGRAEEQD